MLVVRVPDGTPLAYGASFERGAGGWWFGQSSAAQRVASPRLPDGPTRLSIEVDRGVGRGKPLRYRLDCDGGRSRGIREPGALCAVLRREWVVLLPPAPDDTTCLRHREAMTVEGTLGGVSISRDYADCYADTTRRWKQLLGVRP